MISLQVMAARPLRGGAPHSICRRTSISLCRSLPGNQGGCCGGSASEASTAPAGQSQQGGCGCSGGGSAARQEESAAQGVIQAFDNMLGGPEGRVSREDLAAAFATPRGEVSVPEGAGGGERFWDVREVLAGAPADLVFSEEDEELEGMVV